MKRIVSICVGVSLCFAVDASAEITSTLQGGLWDLPGTWEGNVVPGSDDAVAIAGPVQISGTRDCASLSVLETGLLSGAPTGPNNTVAVAGSVSNAGTIEDGTFYFFVEVGGDLANTGSWLNRQTIITGSSERGINVAQASVFSSNLVFAADASGDLIAEQPLYVHGNVDVTGGRLILPTGCPLSVDQGYLSGDVMANHNEVRIISWSYLDHCTLDQAVLVGEVEAGILVRFTGGVTVEGVLQNLSTAGGGGVVVEGGLVNKGIIRNNQYGFAIFLSGDLVNHGEISCSQVLLDGVGEHHLSMGPDGVISANVFLPEFQGGTIVADSGLHFADGVGLGGGTVFMEPGSSLRFTSWGAITNGIIEANGNEIRIDGNGALHGLTIHEAVLEGVVPVEGGMVFNDGLTILGTMQNWQWAATEVEVNGLLRNEGTLRDNVQTLAVRARGNVQNLGAWQNSAVILDGSQDQRVGAGAGIATDSFILDSGLSAGTYQWFKDGNPVPGAESATLDLIGISAAEYGAYYCEASAEQVSRTITIAETLGVSAAPPPVHVVLDQNHPNPFNPTTEIHFRLARDEQANLTVYNTAGRIVEVLVDGALAAGPHLVTWQPQGVPSGIYFYRLRAGDVDLQRKCLLLK